jgi:hypothetical protein
MGDILAARGIPAPPGLLETEHTLAAESQILAKFVEVPGLALASLEVECRQTLCRLQFVAPRTVPEGPRAQNSSPDSVPGLKYRVSPSSFARRV